MMRANHRVVIGCNSRSLSQLGVCVTGGVNAKYYNVLHDSLGENYRRYGLHDLQPVSSVYCSISL
ncbi:hypothetical protein JXA88_03190, partial [Candidatus Fermentibacteria bacterium]|nr:hypothetical protein [Candidatus Fermentibacteria bacterium]